MKFTTSALLLAALASSAVASIFLGAEQAQATRPDTAERALATPMVANEILEERQVPGQVLATTPVATQVSPVTTQYIPVQISETTDTWLPFIYTQTFSLPVIQAPSPGVGQIGYGTLSKRDVAEAEPTPNSTGIAGRIRRM